ncbi:MAG TPA: DUF1269 domain-containing protein [Gaiellaceae bacterium]
MSGKAQFVAVVYETHERADQGLAAIEELDGVVDAVVVVKQPGGHVDLRQTRGTSTGEGAVAGGTVGLLAGLLLGVPVGAALAGILAGGAFGLRDTGIPDDRLRQLGADLTTEQGLLCVLVEPAELPHLREALGPYGGEVVEAGVSSVAP